MANTFKTAMFGGFDKQDVTSYIERIAAENSAKVTELEKERDELLAAREGLDGECETLRQENSVLTERCDELRSELTETAEARDALQARVDELAPLPEEVASLRAELERLRAMEQEYQINRARMVDVELEARRRAEETVSEGQAKADALLADAQAKADAQQQEAQMQADTLLRETNERCAAMQERLRGELRSVTDQCTALKAEVASVTAHVSSELRKMDVAASQLPLAFNHLQSSLETMAQETAKEETEE